MWCVVSSKRSTDLFNKVLLAAHIPLLPRILRVLVQLPPPKSAMFALTSDVGGGMLRGQRAGESGTVERNRAKDSLQSWELVNVWLCI